MHIFKPLTYVLEFTVFESASSLKSTLEGLRTLDTFQQYSKKEGTDNWRQNVKKTHNITELMVSADPRTKERIL